jgi:hypothetical protein
MEKSIDLSFPVVEINFGKIILKQSWFQNVEIMNINENILNFN